MKTPKQLSLSVLLPALIFVLGLGCLRSGSQGGSVPNWFKNAEYVYELSPSVGQAGGGSPSKFSLNIEDWNGYYDQYTKRYEVFPGDGTVPVSSIIESFRQQLEPAVINLEDRFETERHGGINFGGVLFRGALVDFYFNGEIKNTQAAFAVLNNAEPTSLTVKAGVLAVDAPIPEWTNDNWSISVTYPGELLDSNAPAHDSKNKVLLWTDETAHEDRIRFSVRLFRN